MVYRWQHSEDVYNVVEYEKLLRDYRHRDWSCRKKNEWLARRRMWWGGLATKWVIFAVARVWRCLAYTAGQWAYETNLLLQRYILMTIEALIDKHWISFRRRTDREYRVRQELSRERQTPGSEKRTQTGGQVRMLSINWNKRSLKRTLNLRRFRRTVDIDTIGPALATSSRPSSQLIQWVVVWNGCSVHLDICSVIRSNNTPIKWSQ